MEELLTIPPTMSQPAKKNITAVISQFSNRLMSFIRRRVNNEADAEDVLQDVWYQLTTAVDTQPIEQLSGWLFTVARNKITDRYRKKGSESLEELLDPGEEEEGFSFSRILADPSPGPEMEYLYSLFWKTLEESLGDLPEEQRSVFVRNELEGMSFREISAITGEKINTLISRKRYAVLYLREKLQELYDEIINL